MLSNLRSMVRCVLLCPWRAKDGAKITRFLVELHRLWLSKSRIQESELLPTNNASSSKPSSKQMRAPAGSTAERGFVSQAPPPKIACSGGETMHHGCRA